MRRRERFEIKGMALKKPSHEVGSRPAGNWRASGCIVTKSCNIGRCCRPEGGYEMKNRFLSLLCVLALCLGLLPVTALAAEGAPDGLYVGSQQVMSGSDITYWTTDTDGKLTRSAAGQSWNVKYDPSTATLTLKNANISGSFHQYNNPYTAGIYAQGKSNQPVALTIELIGTNTITGTYGIFLNAEINASSYGTNATLTITGENNGSLGVSGSDHGIYVKSGTGNASLNIKDVAVTSSTNGSYAAGVYVMSSANATGSPNISLSVNGGNLTASGTGSSDGIWFYVGSSQATGATTSLTVTDNAIVDARNGGISASNPNSSDLSDQIVVGSGTGTSGGIVFDGSTGTVYGDVTLDESLTINQGETLTIPEGSTLNSNSNLTNNGTINVENGGTVSGSLNDGTTITTPTINVQPQDEEVQAGSTAEFSVTASAGEGEQLTYQWQQKATDTGSEWEDIFYATTASYTIAATTTDMSGYQYRCVVKSASGVSVISSAATLTVTASTGPTTYTISTAEQLYAFANAVNTGNVTANAVLTADINLTDANWTPIGKENSCMYNGTFDGAGYTISGLQCSVSSGDVAGLFGVIGSSGVVKNVGIADSDVAVSTTGQLAYAGGVCGYSAGTVENCWNSGSVTATCNDNGAYAGGVCGYSEGTVENCWNSGSVTANSSDNGAYAGGVCGCNLGTIENCWSSGSVTANSSDNGAYAGGVCGVSSSSTITNCYWLAGTAEYGIGNPQGNTAAESKTTDEFASGEVAWLLNQGQTGTPWGQGSNNMPVLEGNLPAGVTSYVPVRITIVMTDNTQKSYYSAKGSAFTEYPTGYAFFFKENGTQTWINKGTQTYDADATIYAENMTLEKIPAKAATCTEKGNSEYWYSEAYDKYFSDEDGVTEITAADTVIKATGHQLTKVAAKEPTSTQAGNIEYWVCSTCGKYFSDEQGKVEIENVVIPATGHSSGGGTPSKTPSQQAIDKIESAKDGATVEITLSSGSTKLDKEVFEELAGRDVTLEISMPGGVTWTVNGQDIPADADLTDLDLGVSMNTSTIPVDLINAVTGEIGTVQLTLKHDGEFGFTMTLSAPLGAKNAGLWANLYRYDEDAGKLAYQSAALVDEDGNVALSFDHASQYALVLDSKSHELPFTDVPEDAWYYDGVQFAYVRGIMKGTGDATTFSPAMPLNRAMLMTMLARLAGVDTEGGATWYEKGLAWAVAAGVSDGTAPERDITRQELMTMLYRYVGSPAVSGDLSSYPDGAGVAAWAEDAMLWSVQAGLLQGDDAGKLNPAASATRMEVAVILMRFCGNVQD